MTQPLIIHIITGLNQGGAETVLLRLVTHLKDFKHEVISLAPTPPSSLEEEFLKNGIVVQSLNMSWGKPFSLLKIGHLIRQLKERNPFVVQTWMYHANLIGGVAARLAQVDHIIWNIRNGSLQPGDETNTPLSMWDSTSSVVRLGAWFSKIIPTAILSCSKRAVLTHGYWGYADKFFVIPNGVDEEVFKPVPKKRVSIRREWKVEERDVVIGLIGRFHPQKDIQTFFAAAKIFAVDHPNAKFLLCGNGQDRKNAELNAWIQEKGLSDKVILTGKRKDIPDVLNGLDILCSSSSFGEGFPNVVAEAMACGVPCVVTDIGDSALIVGECGEVVAPGKSEQMAQAWGNILRDKPKADAVRGRIVENFTLTKMAERYGQFYRSLSMGKLGEKR